MAPDKFELSMQLLLDRGITWYPVSHSLGYPGTRVPGTRYQVPAYTSTTRSFFLHHILEVLSSYKKSGVTTPTKSNYRM